MRYRLTAPEPHGHLFHVEAELERPGVAPELCFPVWTPGQLPGPRVRPPRRGAHRRRRRRAARSGSSGSTSTGSACARAAASRVVLRYRVYANELTVRTCHLDGTHGFLNGAAVFPYARRARAASRTSSRCARPPGWSVATALDGRPDRSSPRVTTTSWPTRRWSSGRTGWSRFTALGKPHEIALWGRGNVDEARLAEDARRIVETLGALMGGLPYDRYLFIVHLTDKRRGGLEHAASTTLNVQRLRLLPAGRLRGDARALRPRVLPRLEREAAPAGRVLALRLRREQYTRLLWWFEGATSYYEQLALVRAGLARREEVPAEPRPGADGARADARARARRASRSRASSRG